MPGFLLFLFFRASLNGLLVFFCFVHSYFFATTDVKVFLVFVFLFVKRWSRLIVCHGFFCLLIKANYQFITSSVRLTR